MIIELSKISTNVGSLAGGTYLTIQGAFLYTDSNVPADIKVGGKIFQILTIIFIHNKGL